MKRALLAAFLVAGAALAPGSFCRALAGPVESAENVVAPAAEESSLRPGSSARIKRTSQRAAKQSLTPKRRRAIGGGAAQGGKRPGRDADSGPAGSAMAPAVLRQLRVVMRAIRNHDERAREGVSGARLRALALIDSRPGLQVGAFALELGVHQSTASNMLEHLARQGLVEKRRDGEDHRTVSLFATARARTMLKGGTHADAMEQALNRLPPSTLAALQERLAELIRALPAGKIIPA